MHPVSWEELDREGQSGCIRGQMMTWATNMCVFHSVMGGFEYPYSALDATS